MPQIIGRIPQRGLTRNQWDRNITDKLYELWFDRMPSADRKVALTHKPRWLARISGAGIEVLDEIIIRQAETLGWRIGLSELVQWRLSEWESTPSGTKQFKRYHSAIERATRIFQRLEKPPLDDPGFYAFKANSVKELRVVLKIMRNRLKTRLGAPPSDLEPLIASEFIKIVKKGSKSFPALASNRERWGEFIGQNPTEVRQYLSSARHRPASLFDLWFSWSKGVDPEWIRQVISRLGSSPRTVRNAKL
jgi:hypothetical protein